MADISLTLSNVGKTALAAAHGAGNNFPITRLKVGQGQYTPDGTETDIKTPFAPIKEFVNPSGSASGTTFQFVYQDPSPNVYNIGEIGIFSGVTLLAIASRPAADGWLLQKGALPLVVPSVYDFANVATGAITFTVNNVFPLATETTPGIVSKARNADIPLDDNRYMTPAKTEYHFTSKEATQTEYDSNLISKWVASNLAVAASKLKGTLSILRLPRASQDQYNAGGSANAGYVVTADLTIPGSRISGPISRDRLPDSHLGNRAYRVTSANVNLTGSKVAPVISNVVDIDTDGKVQLGAGVNLPVLVITFIPSGGGDTRYVYSAGLFMGLRLHTAGNSLYAVGADIYLQDDFSGFHTSSGRKVGKVIDVGNRGLYDVTLDLWAPFLNHQRERIITADPTQADIDSIPDGGRIIVRSTTAYTP